MLEEEHAMAEYEDEFDQESIMASQAAADEAEDPDGKAPPLPKINPSSKVERALDDHSREHQKPLVRKPLSSATKRARDDFEQDGHPVCPICQTPLPLDNVDLNQHVDFCLSKKAIMTATTLENEASKKQKL